MDHPMSAYGPKLTRQSTAAQSAFEVQTDMAGTSSRGKNPWTASAT
jgi:hypothetical protein